MEFVNLLLYHQLFHTAGHSSRDGAEQSAHFLKVELSAHLRLPNMARGALCTLHQCLCVVY